VREGLGKHGSGRVAMAGEFGDAPQPSLEAQIVDVCDEIAYNNHDIDDGLASGLLNLDQVLEALPLWRLAWEELKEAAPETPESLRISETVRTLIDRQTTDLMECTLDRLTRLKIAAPDEARARPKPLAEFGPKMRDLHAQQRRFLYENLYRHPEVIAATDDAAQALRHLYNAYREGRLPLSEMTVAAQTEDPPERRILDVIAGMTDDQALLMSGQL
jgi:dGTPase